MKILVVDDDHLIRDLTATALSYCVNREVKSFDSSRTAWEYIRSGNDVDIVISDVDMPDMNGFELLARVRELYPDLLFILMSGEEENASRSRTSGASAFLSKPFEISDLFNIVQCYVVDPV